MKRKSKTPMNPMNPFEIKKAMLEALETTSQQPTPPVEFSKKLLIGVLSFVGVFCIVSTAAWFLTGDWPREIAEFFIWPIIAVVSYMLKTAYENKAKIQGGDKS